MSDSPEAVTQLQQTVGKLEIALGAIAVGIVLTDARGVIQWCNQAFDRLSGRPHAGNLGQSLLELLPLEREGRSVRAEEHPVTFALRGQTCMTDLYTFVRGGQHIELEISGTNVSGGAGDIGVVFVLRDVTGRNQAAQHIQQQASDLAKSHADLLQREEIMHSLLEDLETAKEELDNKQQSLQEANTRLERLAAIKDEFVAHVSHELRTPLAITREGLSLIIDGVTGPTTERQSQLLHTMLDNIDRLTRIINDLLDISKLEAGRVELHKRRVNLPEVARNVVSLFLPKLDGRGLSLHVDAPAQPLEAYGDPDKIIQVITNLVGNAAKFTTEGSITVSVGEQNGAVVCAVADTGRGISADDLPKVFSKFQQFGRTEASGGRGTGLGLVISKQLVELHGGAMRVDSVLNKGTTFTFTLPKYDPLKLFHEVLVRELQEAVRLEASVSLVVLKLRDVQTLESPNGGAVVNSLDEIEQLLTQRLRANDSIIVKDTGTILIVLPGTKHSDAVSVAGRLERGVQEWLAAHGGAPGSCAASVASFPEDGSTVEELVDKVNAFTARSSQNPDGYAQG